MRKVWIVAGVTLAALVAAAAVWFAALFLPPGPVETVTFQSADGTTLQGRYFTPAGREARAPAVVILHGSGPETGDSPAYQLHAVALARAGIGVLTYAKRGVAPSGGDFEAATLLEFAADGAAAVRSLRTRPDVNPEQIGLIGLSEGGWLTPLIAEQEGAIAFIYNRAGPLLSWGEVNVYENATELRAAGFGDEEIDQASSLRWALWNYYRDAGAANDPLTSRRAALERRVDDARQQAWFEVWSMRVAPFEADVYNRWASDVWFDPSSSLRAIDTPILASFAGDDENVPTHASVAALEAIRAERSGDIEIVVYPGRKHSMFKWRDLPVGGYPPDYFPSLTQWIRRQID